MMLLMTAEVAWHSRAPRAHAQAGTLEPPVLLDPAPPDSPGDGAVVLRLSIDAGGQVSAAEVVTSAGAEADARARAAAFRLRFAPARRDGVPVPSRILYAYRPPAPPAARAPVAAPIEVVVTGSRMPQPVRRSPVAVEVIPRAEIEQSGARDAAELLEERPGLQISRSFRGSELWLRGLAPEYALILVDGERVPGRIDGAVDLSRYGVENLERVEIVRGPSSALYGSDAIGGVVNLITRESRRPFEADALASGGTHGVADVTGFVAGRPADALQLSATGGVHHADAYARDGGAATAGSARMQASAGARAAWRPDAENRLVGRADYVRLSLEGVDQGAASALFDRTQLQEQLQASLGHELAAPGGVALQTRVTYSQFREQYLSDQRGSDALDAYEDNREHLLQLTGVMRVPLGAAHLLSAGTDQLAQSLDSERLASSGHRYGLALFAQDEWVPYRHGASTLQIVPGVRADVDSQFGHQVSPKLALRYDPVEPVILRASYGHGFRAPSFQELLLHFENAGVGYVVDGNPRLSAERSDGFDVSAEWKPRGWIAMSAAFFRNDLRDMIAIVSVAEGTAAGTRYAYENLERAWTMGVESALRLDAADYASATLGYTWLRTWDGENQRELEGRAKHRVTLGARFAWPAWQLELTTRAAVAIGRVYFVEQQDGSEARVTPAAQAQLDARVAKHFGRYLEVFAGVDNLLDAGDSYAALRPFTLYAGARGRYGDTP
jgi:outer membrane receptor for ferrienterochelin and colicins